MMYGKIFIDVQGFKGSYNQFILKEIAVLSEENQVQHFIIQPTQSCSNLPHHLQVQAQWLYNNYHNLSWNGGFTDLDPVVKWISQILKEKHIYVKGAEKVKWIIDLFQLDKENVCIEDLDRIGCPNLDTLRKTFTTEPRCMLHSGCCALQNTYLCKKFIEKNKEIN